MKPGVMAAIVVAILVAIGAFVFIGSDDSTDEDSSSQTAQTQSNDADAVNNDAAPADTAEQTDENALSAANVATHDNANDCWIIIEGSVYDVTSYVSKHPGGAAIVQACGGDGTTLFKSRTTEDGQTVGSGTPHSSRAEDQLAEFKLGELVN